LEKATSRLNEGYVDLKIVTARSRVTTVKSNRLCDDLAEICRLIFAIKEDSIPVAFVLFPFIVEWSGDGHGMLVVEKNADVAMYFAKFMMAQTSHTTVLNSIDEKLLTQEKILRNRESKKAQGPMNLRKLYSKGGWFYFIDECSGTPIIGSKSDGMYPIHI
jgi:hypothetical protein